MFKILAVLGALSIMGPWALATSSAPAAPVEKTTTSRSTDYFQQGWDPSQVSNQLGVDLNTGLATYQRWMKDRPNWGYTLHISINKSSDSTTETNATSTNATSLTSSSTTQYFGNKNPETITLGAGFKNKIFQNNWLQVTWGGVLTYAQTSAVSYRTGSVTRTVSNINNPNDYSVSENALGTVSIKPTPAILWGPRVGSEFYLRWFPNLALYGEIALLTSLSRKSTNSTETVTRSYVVVAGVPQAPTSESYSSSVSETDFGYSRNTSSVGSSYFNFFSSNWGIRYSW